ncbi:MAG: hypothetical protein JRF36_11125 [Deltaproteobacteria bacterium]|jgi:hypothetical protein|nr:hypothetical protein [Deltaproteobacteria bacterium]
MNEFKKCTFCGHRWQTRKDFLEDATLDLIGYQVNFDYLHLGYFLFNHLTCGTTIGLAAGLFRDLYRGPVYEYRQTGTDKCPEYCLHEKQLEPCPAECECTYVREIIQTVRQWPKIGQD